MAAILTIVAATAGLLGFAVATVPKLDQFRRDFNGTDLTKDWYQTQLDSVQTKLDSWRDLWCDDHTLSREDYEHFWGTSGYEIVTTKMRLIMAELCAIGRLLERKIDKTLEFEMGQEWREQRAWLRRDETAQMVKSHANIIQKTTFAMFRGTELEERVKRLQEKVKDLESYSQERFVSIQLRLPSNETLEATTPSRLLNRRIWIEEQTEIFGYLHGRSIENTGVGWSLALAVPEADWSFDNDTGLRAIFDIQQCPFSLTDLGLISFHSASLEEAQRCRFTEPRRRDDYLRVALAEAAIGLVDWTMLLWGTPWTDGICTCGLRLVTATLNNGSTQMTATFQNRRPCDKNEFGHDGVIQARKALLLGISLAEFALARLIRVQMAENGPLRFYMGTGCWTERDLLNEIARVNPPYRDAVSLCFKHDRDLANDRDFRLHHYLWFQEQVVKRLKEHLKGVYRRRSLTNRRQLLL